MYSKSKLKLTVSIKEKFHGNKQTRSLMPNLIHSLDATSICLLYNEFYSSFIEDSPQFFSVQDCFGTTCDKVFTLKTILASVYTDLYTTEPYLYKFDRDIFEYISSKTDYIVDLKERSVSIPNIGKYLIHDID